MNASFYLFNVDHGQCAAMRLPNGRWCIFDVGCTRAFSPIRWIAHQATLVDRAPGIQTSFRFLKATISHLHGDHLADYRTLFQYGPEFLRTVNVDKDYLEDCYATCSDILAKLKLKDFIKRYYNSCLSSGLVPNYGCYGNITIREQCLPVEVARSMGGDANARVNNASIVTRIDVYGNSILICGDVQKEAWAAIIKDFGRLWQPFLSNVDILVAPHHGHRSGYSVELLNLAQPAVVLVSVVTRDPNVDTRYSQSPVRGMIIGGTSYSYISTRRNGHIKVDIIPPAQLGFGQKGSTYWTFGDAAIQ